MAAATIDTGWNMEQELLSMQGRKMLIWHYTDIATGETQECGNTVIRAWFAPDALADTACGVTWAGSEVTFTVTALTPDGYLMVEVEDY